MGSYLVSVFEQVSGSVANKPFASRPTDLQIAGRPTAKIQSSSATTPLAMLITTLLSRYSQ